MSPSRVAAIRIALAALLLAGCSSGASFDPAGPCTGDGRMAGAYPDLEARIPATFEGKPPAHLDSGRNCTAANLGTLAAVGIDEVRFAGGVWELGARSGMTLAVMTASGLTQDQVADFYEAGARGGRRTEDVQRTAEPGSHGQWDRVDTLNDESYQTIVVLQPGDAGRVHVALIGSDIRETVEREIHDGRVAAAVDAWEQAVAVE